MTNKELYLKIKQELGKRYQIGLHNSTKERYIVKSKFNYDIFCMNIDNITENNIISSIMNNGLYIPDKYAGLISTVTFLDKLRIDSFNYCYYADYGIDMKESYVVVVAIPNYICIKGKRYFIGDMNEYISVANYSLFHMILPKELIYGYYVKKIRVDNFNKDVIYENDLEFYSNDNFYGYMTFLEQEEFWLKYFEDNEISISVLNDFNSKFNLFDRLLNNCMDRDFVLKAREQFKRRILKNN